MVWTGARGAAKRTEHIPKRITNYAVADRSCTDTIGDTPVADRDSADTIGQSAAAAGYSGATVGQSADAAADSTVADDYSTDSVDRSADTVGHAAAELWAANHATELQSEPAGNTTDDSPSSELQQQPAPTLAEVERKA
jgi:hypothetical protein